MIVRVVNIPNKNVWFKKLLNKDIEVEDNNNESYYKIVGSNNVILKEYCIKIKD